MIFMYRFYRQKNIPSYIIFLFLFFIQKYTVAQENKACCQDTLFTKFTDTTVYGYSNTRPYSITAWKQAVPHSVKIIRRLSEWVAIIKINRQTLFDSLSLQTNIAAANDNWKFSPAAAREIQHKKGLQKIILTALDTGELLAVLQKGPNTFEIFYVDKYALTKSLKPIVSNLTKVNSKRPT